MRFELVDRIIEQSPDQIVTIKAVSAAEEYLADHFPTFPVLPGVMMLESMVQAARILAAAAGPSSPERPLVLGRVRALKYGRFVKPGSFLRVQVAMLKPPGEGEFEFRGEATVIEPSGGGRRRWPCRGRAIFPPSGAAPGGVGGGQRLAGGIAWRPAAGANPGAASPQRRGPDPR